MVRTLDPKDVLIIVSGIPISGFEDGTFVLVERTSDTFTTVSGADGIVTRVKQNDRTGSVTITLAQSSESNAVLSGLAIADELSGIGVFPVVVKDNRGTSLYFSDVCWIRKVSNAEFSKDVNSREWVIDCSNLEIFNGGNALTEAA